MLIEAKIRSLARYAFASYRTGSPPDGNSFCNGLNTSCRKSHLSTYSVDNLIENFRLNVVQAKNLVPMQIVSSGPDNSNFGIRRPMKK